MSESQPTRAYRTVWVYDDPASGIEVHMDSGIGKKVDLPADLLDRFDRALTEYEAAQEAIADAAGI